MYLSLFYLDSRNAALLWSLHAYLVPTQKKVQVDANGKKMSQNSPSKILKSPAYFLLQLISKWKTT